MLKKISVGLITSLLLTQSLFSGTSVSQNFSIKVVEQADEISVSGDPPLLQVTAGGSTLTNTSTNYSYTSGPGANRVITARITNGASIPAGVVLTVELAPGPEATSTGAVTLSNTPQNVITDIPPVKSGTNLTITYELSADDTATATSTALEVTFTIQ